MTETIERILHVLPADNVLICECGAAIRYSEVIHYLAKCPKCHKEQDYRTMQTISLAAYVEREVSNLTNKK